MRKFSYLTAAFLTAVFVLNAAPSFAAASTINEAVSKKDLTSLQTFLDQGQVDDVVKALLKSVHDTIKTDPDGAQKKITLAAEYADKITPPSVPAICADLRRIAETFAPEELDTPLHDAFIEASQSFAASPVVVAQGTPNLCEAEELLMQTPVYRMPKIIKPNPPPDPDSAD